MKKTLSVALIVKNEEKKIEKCLRAVSWADEIIVVDSGSKDRTVMIAEQLKAKVFTRHFDNFCNQKNYAIEQAASDWVLCLDADEIVTPELSVSIQRVLADQAEISGYFIRRQNFIFGRRLRFGGQGEDWILRLFEKGKGQYQQIVHETLSVEGSMSRLQGDLLHFSTANVQEYHAKMNLYTGLEAKLMRERGDRYSVLKQWLYPPLRFFYYYFIRLGFLDGREGFLFHFLSSKYYWTKYRRFHALLKSRVS